MSRIPVVFAFDNNLAMPAAVCIYSLFANAYQSTAYQVYVLHREGKTLDTSFIDKVFASFPQHSLRLVEVDGTFDNGFEIRGITTPAYYRLLIPELIPEHDKVIYSDVDVIFRADLSEIYDSDIENHYFIGVNAIAHLDADLNSYYSKLRLDPTKIIYSGNLIINSRKFRENPSKSGTLLALSKNNYKFQDMDAINIACKDEIGYIGPEFCLTTYICDAYVNKRRQLLDVWSETQLEKAMSKGLVHYNGKKPWEGCCLNFDIWWEYYRRSPIFDRQFHFRFFYNRLNEYDTLPLMKRVRNLMRYFIHGRKKPI